MHINAIIYVVKCEHMNCIRDTLHKAVGIVFVITLHSVFTTFFLYCTPTSHYTPLIYQPGSKVVTPFQIILTTMVRNGDGYLMGHGSY